MVDITTWSCAALLTEAHSWPKRALGSRSEIVFRGRRRRTTMAVRHECKVAGPPSSSSSSVMVAISPRLVLQGGCRPLSGPLLPPSAEMRAVFCFSGGQSGMSSWSHCSPVPDWARVVWGSFYPSKWALFCLVVCLCVCVSVSLFRRCFGLHCGFGVERDTCLGRPRIAGSRYSGYLGCSASDDRGNLCLM